MLSIGAVARQTGIGADTLRKWELRYGFPLPLRSETGRRMFQESDVQKIHAVARALAQGQRVGLAIEAVVSIAQQTVQTNQARSPTTRKGEELARSIALLSSNDLDLFQTHLEADLSRMGMAAFVEEIALPLVHEVGLRWQAGLLPIFREHAFSSHLTSLVAKHTKDPDRKPTQQTPAKARRPVLLALPAGEHHGLALILLNALMREAGLSTVLMKSGLPASEIAKAAKAYRSKIVVLSCSQASPKKLLHNELTELRRLLPASVELWAGGAGALQLPSGIAGVMFSHAMNDAVKRALDI